MILIHQTNNKCLIIRVYTYLFSFQNMYTCLPMYDINVGQTWSPAKYIIKRWPQSCDLYVGKYEGHLWAIYTLLQFYHKVNHNHSWVVFIRKFCIRVGMHSMRDLYNIMYYVFHNYNWKLWKVNVLNYLVSFPL